MTEGKNMTVKELSQYYYLTREIDELKSRIRQAKARATDTSVTFTATPSGSQQANKIVLSVEKLVLYENELQKRMEECEKELIRLNRFISKCDDSLTRQILTYRFVYCLPWKQVSRKIGAGTTVESVKMTAYRYIRTKK